MARLTATWVILALASCQVEEVVSTATRLNRPPVANDDAYGVAFGSPLVVDAALGLLANDTDEDGDELLASVGTDPTGGTLALDADGSFTYTPTVFSPVDTFIYAINDGSETDTAQVTITVGNQSPTAVAQAIPTTGPAPLTVDFDASGSTDPDGSVTSWVWNFDDGTADGNGETTSHTFNDPGAFVVTLTVEDDAGATHDDTVQIDVLDPTPTIAAWSVVDQNPNTFWSDSSWARSFRILVEGPRVIVGASRIAVSLWGRSTGAYTVRRVSIAKRDAATLDVIDATTTQVTFGGTWDDGATVTAGCSLASDPFDFDLTPGEDLFVTFWAETPAALRDVGLGQTNTWTINGTDHSTTLDWEGLPLNETRDHVYALELIAALGSRDNTDPVLVGHWPLDGLSGSRIDASGRGNGLSDTGGVGVAAGMDGMAASFSGSAFLSIPETTLSGLDANGALTITAWINASDTTSTGAIAAKYDTGLGERSYVMRVSADTLRATLSNDGSVGTTLAGTTTLSTGQWYHVALVFDGCAQSATLYLDGVPDVTQSVTFSALHDSAADFTVGAKRDNANPHNFFTGLIDDVRIFATALSQVEIQALMN